MSPSRTSPDPESLPAVAGYRLLRLVGRGAHGAVFLGYATDALRHPTP